MCAGPELHVDVAPTANTVIQAAPESDVSRSDPGATTVVDEDPLPEANAAKDGADDADDETGSAEQGLEEVPAIVLNPEQPEGLVDLLPDFLADLSHAPPDFLVDLALQLTTRPPQLQLPPVDTARPPRRSVPKDHDGRVTLLDDWVPATSRAHRIPPPALMGPDPGLPVPPMAVRVVLPHTHTPAGRARAGLPRGRRQLFDRAREDAEHETADAGGLQDVALQVQRLRARENGSETRLGLGHRDRISETTFARLLDNRSMWCAASS